MVGLRPHGWERDRYPMQRHLVYSVYLVGIGNNIKVRGYGGEVRRGERE